MINAYNPWDKCQFIYLYQNWFSNQSYAGVPPLQATGYVRVIVLVVVAIKNWVFSFADMLLFLPCLPDFQPVLDNIWSCSISYSFNVASITLQFITSKLFLDFRVLFKDLSRCNTFYNLHDFWRRILLFTPTNINIFIVYSFR
jgi:hypothetical protein